MLINVEQTRRFVRKINIKVYILHGAITYITAIEILNINSFSIV